MSKPVAHILKDLRLSEISLCEYPASPGAHVAIFKATDNPLHGEAFQRISKALTGTVPAEGMAAFNDAIQKAGEVTAQMFKDALATENAQRASYYVMQNVNQGVYALGDSIRSIYADASVTDKAAAVEETTTEFLNWIKTAISPAQIDAGMSGDDAGDQGVEKMANKAKTEADPEGTGTVSVPSKIGKGDAGKAHPDGGMIGEDGKVAKSITLGDDETVIKKSDFHQIVAEAVEKAMADPNGEPAKLRASIAKMQEERETNEIIQKATRLVDGVPLVTVEQATAVMKALKDNPTALAAYEGTLNAARIAKDLGPIGADGSTGTAVKASVRLDTMTDEYKAAQEKVGKTISRATAMDHVLQQNPGLYAEIKKERTGR